MLTAASVWPDCQHETTLFCWARESEVVGRQHTSQISFSVVTAINNKVVDFLLPFWSLSRPLCCSDSSSSVAVPSSFSYVNQKRLYTSYLPAQKSKGLLSKLISYGSFTSSGLDIKKGTNIYKNQ